MATRYTLGSSTWSFDDLLELLRAYRVQVLVDIRRFPRSRTNPQFDTERLHVSLPASGIAYRRLERLGGCRNEKADSSPDAAWENDSFRADTRYVLAVPFQEGLEELIALGAEHPVAVVYAETVYRRCHHRTVFDWLHARARGRPPSSTSTVRRTTRSRGSRRSRTGR